MKIFLSSHRLVAAGICLGGCLAWARAAEPVAKTGSEATASSKFVINGDGFLVVGFDQLASYEFTPPTYDAAGGDGKAQVKKGPDQIPERIKALNEKKVMVTGFMLPIKMDQGLVKEFLLVKDPMMCCYGIMPKINEWVVVKMVGPGVAALMDIPISFEGKLAVGELYDNGYLTGVYLLEGEKQAKQK